MRRYLFSVSLRYDGASQFTEGNRFTFFPAVSAGWNMHYENWFPKDIVSRLKLRASWGKTGNNNLTYSDTQGEYAVYPYGGNGGILNSVLANNKLIWETTSNVDIGFDAGFFDNRLELSATGYNKLTTDRLYDKSLPAETGFEIIKANLGTVQNKGIEITLTVHPLSTSSPLKWDITGSFSLNRTYMKKLPYNGRDKNRVQGGIVLTPPLVSTLKLAVWPKEKESVEDGDINTWEFMIQTKLLPMLLKTKRFLAQRWAKQNKQETQSGLTWTIMV